MLPFLSTSDSVQTLFLRNALHDCVCVLSHSAVSDSVVPWAVAHKAPLSMEFSRQEYWSGLPIPIPGDLPNPHLSCLLHWQAGSLPQVSPGKPCLT